MVSLTIQTKNKPTIKVDFPDKHPNSISIEDLKSAIQAKFPKLEHNRQRISFKPLGEGKPTPLLDESKTLGSYGVPEGGKLLLKDLGRQIGYRALYQWEYVGPIFLNPLFLRYSHLLWGSFEPSALQLTVRNYIVLHFIKRVVESTFVHSFSRSSVPLLYVYRNCLYYWGVTGLLIGLTLYRPGYSKQALEGSILNNPTWLRFWSIFIFVNELANLYTHIHLASLRQPEGKPRIYPTGFGFGTIVCANYFFETLGVIALVIMTGGDLGSIVYLSIATYFMALWAGQKYRRYKKEFAGQGYPGKRYIMFPPFY